LYPIQFRAWLRSLKYQESQTSIRTTASQRAGGASSEQGNHPPSAWPSSKSTANRLDNFRNVVNGPLTEEFVRLTPTPQSLRYSLRAQEAIKSTTNSPAQNFKGGLEGITIG